MKKVNELALIAGRARFARRKLSVLSSSIKDRALRVMASELQKGRRKIMGANREDLRKAGKKRLSSSFIDRLTLTKSSFDAMVDSVLQISKLPDPVGEVIKMWRRPNGLQIAKVRVPLGVICIIYESRPNVSVDASCLCLKSGNCVILRGGADAINSNTAIVDVLENASIRAGIPEGSIQIVRDTSHKVVNDLLKLSDYIDLVIPRGGESLIKTVSENSRIPVIKHYKGVCHVYIDANADFRVAERISFNAKVERPGVCNAMETMLVHKESAGKFLRPMLEKFRDAGVELRGCEKVRKFLPWVKKAKETDWSTEYLDLVLAVKIVSDIDEAIDHINNYGSSHSDAIVTTDYESVRKFTERVDSACVFVNASTRFSDGGEFGFGAEMGISTDRLHARGPMALEELTTYKYVIYGEGQIRE